MKGKQPGSSLTKPQWDLSRLTPFQKNFYQESPVIVNRPQYEVDEYM